MKRITLFSIIANAIVVLLAPLVIWSQTYTNIRITTNTNDQSETAIAIDPLNSQKLLATWNSFSATAILPPGYSFSTDGGLTWSRPAGVPSPSGYDRGFDPSCTFDRLGNAFYCYIASTGGLGPVYVSKTTNLGTSWTHANVSSGTSDDKPFITVDNTGGARNGRLYVVWTEISGSYPNFTYKIHAAYSSNNGTSFTRASTDPLDNITSSGNMISFQPTQSPNTQLRAFVSGAMPAVAPNGDLYVAWLRNEGTGTGSIRIRKSTDGGLTFGTTYTVANVTPFRNYIGNLDILNFPSIVVDQNTGRIYVAYTDKPGNNMNVYYNYSTNGGQTWSSRTIATQDTTGNQFFAALSVDPTGKIIFGYYDDRNNPNVDVYLAESFNNGTSFSYHTKITSGYTTNNPANSTWTHHYFGIASTVGFSYPLWTDYRNGNADIYMARVNRRPTSNTANATAGNGQRKLARDANGTYHQVFESNQGIWYARKTSTEGEWNNYQRLNSGTVTSNSSPCIAERGGKVYVIWQKLNGSSYDVYFHKSTDGGTTWPDANRQTLATGVGSNPSLPVIISPATDKLTVVYRTSTNLSYKVSDNSGGTWSSGTVPSSGVNDNAPTLAPTTTTSGNYRSALVYANSASPGTIYYLYYKNGNDSTGWNSTTAKNLSQILSGNYSNHQKPSIAPSGTSGDKRLQVVWEANESGTDVIIHRKATDWVTWPNVYAVISASTQFPRQPNITGLATDTGELLYYASAISMVYKVHYNGSSWGTPVFVGYYAQHPSVSTGYTAAKYIWTEAPTTPYLVKTSTEILSKTEAGLLAVAYHRETAVLDPNMGAWLNVRLNRLSVKTRSGEEFIIPFGEAKEDHNTLTPALAFSNLASSPVSLPADAESLLVHCQVNGQGLSAIRNAANPITVEIVFTGKNGATIKLSVVTTAAAELPETKLRLTAGITAFTGSEVSLRTQVSGIANKSSLIASLGHIYEIVETTLPKFLGPITATLTPSGFVLQAYPNPFNPSTQIHFAMRDAGIATLRIYNLHGQFVRELLHEHRVAGEYTMPWDGRDDHGVIAASGVYFIRFEAGNQVKISKVMLVR